MADPAEVDKDRITRMLRQWSEGDREAFDGILPFIYDELKRQAANCLRRERKNHTVQTTALIHEAYLKLIDQRNVKWESRAHFFAIAARVMRQILVDYARMKRRDKRGGGAEAVPLTEMVPAAGREGGGVDLV